MGNNTSKYWLNASIDKEEHLSEDALARYFWRACTKNPGHQKFIPAKEFRESHLPTQFQNGKVLSLIKAVSDLTVRVIVRNTSEQRPPGDKLYKMKGIDFRCFGSGMVIDVVPVEYDPSGICTCAICAEYPNKPSFTAKVHVSTASHVFLDASEVAETEAELFYDDEKDTESVKTLYGSKVLERSEEEDTCLFECITHDKDLADTLMNKLNSLHCMEEEVRKIPIDSPGSLSFVASHPHGASKHISIGYTAHPRDSSLTTIRSQQKSHDLVKMRGDAASTHPLAQPGTEMKHDTCTSMVNKNDECKATAGISVHVSFPGGHENIFNIWKLGEPVQHTKKWILEQAGFHSQHQNYTLVIDCREGGSVEMDDERIIDHYLDDLTTAVRIWFKEVVVSHPSGASKHISIGEVEQTTMSHDLVKIDGDEAVSLFPSLIEITYDMVNKNREAELHGIEIYVQYAAGGQLYPSFIDRMDSPRQVKYLKMKLLKEMPFYCKDKKYLLVLNFHGNTHYITMDDERPVEYYWMDVTCAEKISFIEGTCIPVDVSYPDGTQTTINFWSREEWIKAMKRRLLEQKDFYGVQKKYTLVVDRPDGDSVEMDDERLMEHYWDNLTTAVRMGFKPRDNTPNSNLSTSTAADLSTIVESGTLDVYPRRKGGAPLDQRKKCTRDVYRRRKGAAPLDQRKKCEYNPGHKMFTSVKEFDINKCNLPKHYQDQLTDSYITSVIRLTVRLAVKYISHQRRDNYTFSKYRGKTVDIAGSGMVCRVLREFNTDDGKGCPCPLCNGKQKNWGIFEVLTSNHLVFNDVESSHTTVYIDYDDCSTKLSSCDKLHGWCLSGSSMKTDSNCVQCVSHDKEICQELEKRLGEYNRLHDKLVKAKKKSKIPVICVSHPHGYSKHVSVGILIRVMPEDPYSWRYTTATCPACSGAPVFILGESLERKKPYHIAVHAGYGGPGYNESGCWNKEDL